MKEINLITLIIIFISSCSTTTVNHRELIPELFDPELKKGKIFIFSNHNDNSSINIRLNGEERQIKHKEILVFKLKDGQNSIQSFRKLFGDEFGNCDEAPYTFDTKMFTDEQTHYFIIQYIFDSQIFKDACLKDFHVKESVFIDQIANPRSQSGEFLQDMTESFFREFVF